MDAAVATKSPAKSVWSTCTAKRQTWVWRAVGGDASTSSPNLMACLESCRVTAGRKIVGNGVWLCFICCPLQGGSNLQPTHEPVNPKPVLLNLNPKKLFCLDLGLGRPLALSGGQLPDEVTGFIDRGSHLCWKRSVWDLMRRSPARKRIKRHVIAQMSSPTLAWNSQVVRAEVF